MSIPREAIQPAADALISYESFVEHLQKLVTSPRVRVERIGFSNEGRGLYTIIIADEKGIANLDHYRRLAARLQRPQVTHHSITHAQQEDRPAVPEDMRYPLLLLAHTFGHEAAHLEALMELADKLAWGSEPEVTAILSRLIVVIHPLANPDGRELALRHWKGSHLAEDSPAAGNHYGFYINRDILHLTQPEGEAVIRLYRDWHPLAFYDLHEDAYLLGVLTPEVCWCPAFGNASGGELPDNIQSIIQRLSDAIIKAWDARSYNYLRGDMFAFPMIGQPEDKPYWFAQGNAIITMGMHGIPSVITESSRTPGSQVWEDRVEQKVSAGMALLSEAAKTAHEIADTIYNNARSLMTAMQSDGFVIPKAQTDLAALSKLIDVLLKQEVRVYQTNQDYIVPLAQPEAKVAETILSGETSKLVAMPAAIGVKVMRLSLLPAETRKPYEMAGLSPVFEAPPPRVYFNAASGSIGHVAVPNTADGVRLVNRLWDTGIPVYWLSKPLTIDGQTLAAGSYIIENVPFKVLETFTRGLYLRLTSIPAGTTIEAHLLRQPKVLVYLGQGVDRPDSVPKAEMWWAMERLEFDFIPLYGKQVAEEWLSRGDLLLMPDGDPSDIVKGWQTTSRSNSDAWDPPGTPDGIGQEGLAAIRRFVEAGGGYLGIGSGGGLLATREYAGIADLTAAYHSLGSGRVILKVSDSASPLMYGLPGSYAENGEWQPDLFAAMYYTESLAGAVGGPIFKTGGSAQPIACYHRVDEDPKTHYIIHPELFDEKVQGVAIAFQKYGNGNVTVTGIRPGFRAMWTHTYKLISNAIFYQTAGAAKSVTLP